MKANSQTRSIAAPIYFCFGLLTGCSDRPSAVDLPSVDASDVASFAMEHYDDDHNGAIDAAEMTKCPPLVVAVVNYDSDSNGQLSVEEIEDRLHRLYGGSSGLISVDCAVSVSGQPLRGATVKFRPVEMLEPSIKPAQGVTNDSGVARIALSAEDMPKDLQDARLMQPGLYHVAITHPTVALPDRYNTVTELGFEVDASQERTGTSARFDLKPE